jgi:hypothetical protein
LFLETLDFAIPLDVWAACQPEPSREEVLRKAMTEVGLDLIDYGSFTDGKYFDAAAPHAALALISVYSKAFRERAERSAGRR